MTASPLDHDGLLIRAAQAGDTDAYAQLVKSYERIAYRAAVFIAGANDAEEVAQLAFIKAYSALKRFELGRPFQPWLLQIVVNEAKTARRAENRRTAILARALTQIGPGDGRSEDRADLRLVRTEANAQLEAALAELPDKQRDVVTCRYLLELSEEETARVLGLRPGTVKSRLSRALERLRIELEGGPAGEPGDASLPQVARQTA